LISIHGPEKVYSTSAGGGHEAHCSHWSLSPFSFHVLLSSLSSHSFPPFLNSFISAGGTSGIGKALTNKFLQDGSYHLTLGVKNLDESLPILQSLSTSQQQLVEFKQLDLSNFKTIPEFVSSLSVCHILVNCAGIMSPATFERVSHLDTLTSSHDGSGIEKTMAVNYFGHFLLTNLLLPILQKSSKDGNCEGRIVHLTSAAEKGAKALPGVYGKSALRGELPDSAKWREPRKPEEETETFNGLLEGFDWLTEGPQPYFRQTAYSNSSLSILLSAIELSRRLNPPSGSSSLGSPSSLTLSSSPSSRVTVNAVCPGYAATPFWDEMFVMKYLSKALFKSPEKASELVFDVCTSAAYEGKTGNFYTSMPNISPSPMASSRELASQVWEQSCAIVGISSTDSRPRPSE
jgi:NAD(P)-dependent dehydrogenase (short-subunit alcohol dehydrogenase family)